MKQRNIETNGIQLRVYEEGNGPLVILAHGWPESWYSWRHQLPALAAAGYHAVAPDMRGYGESSAPEAVEAYDITQTSADLVGIIDALGEDQAVLVGHDWGSIITWNSALLYPERFRAVVGMSVPYGGRAGQRPTETWRQQFGDNFFYILYYQEPDVAEAEYDADPRGILSMLYTSPDTPRAEPTITDPKRSAGGWIGRMGAPLSNPSWLSQEDLDYYVSEFTKAGFRGGINYYRNFDRNWELMADIDPSVKQPALFISGEKDGVIRGADADALRSMMGPVVPDLRDVILIKDVGHWVQQEAPKETNEALISFLDNLES